MEYVANLDNVNHQTFEVVGALSINNKCCKDKHVIVTKTRGIEIYSCQCECGLWCTTGRDSVEGAITEWKKLKRTSEL